MATTSDMNGLEPDGRLIDTLLDRAPAPLAAFGAIVAVGGTQAGYFPVVWGPSAIALLALTAAWLWFGARTDLGRRDLLVLAAFGALLGWVALSVIWSAAPAQTTLEVQRLLVPLAGLAGVLLLARRESVADVALAVVLGITVLGAYGLATRLLPDRVGIFDSQDYRLSEPIGYWNGLGTLAAIGLILALGCAADGPGLARRAACSVAVVVLAPTLYFTFSRAAWVALGIGLAVLVAGTPRKLLTIGTLALLTPAPALAVIAASRQSGLTDIGAPLADAIDDGHAYLATLAALAVVGAAAGVALGVTAERLRPGARTRRTLGIALGVAGCGAAAAVLAFAGTPRELADRAIEGFKQPNIRVSDDLNKRLFQLSGSGRVDIWRTARDVGERHPIVGVGAGTFERYWQRDPRWSFKARDAHSLYLESFAELGVVGLALVGVLFAALVGTSVAARRHAVVPGGLAAVATYAVHAGADWDWELTGVTLAALLAGSLGVIALRTDPVRRVGRAVRLSVGAAVAVVALVSLVGYLGNDALDRAQYALDVGNPEAALDEARTASRFAPWSPYPHTVSGEAHLALNQVGAARTSFRAAIAEDDGYWRAWLGLAVATTGEAREEALSRARALYPRSSAIERTAQRLRGT
jgi:hypothetical protein